ncbi:MAG: UDP-N-acetylmuramate dehydrogenase [Bacteroidota bacterium]|nr:UDP-N-acetylmuramate dehydrogenase [Bacteroidota bacterium]
MELINNASLKPFVTFGVEASCKHLYRIEDLEELRLAVKHLDNPLILGGGSNVLPIGDIQRNVLKVELRGIRIEGKGNDEFILHAAAGEAWHSLVMHAIEHDLGGIENLSLIPGTVGAAPIQNIGAYGVELENVFHSLEAIRIGDGEIVRFLKTDCGFGYRDSIFKREAKDKYVITRVSFRLSKNHSLNTSYGAIQDILNEKNISKPTIRNVSDAVIAIRQSKLPDPAVIGNAGSFFKNPIITKSQFDSLKEVYSTIPSFPTGEENVKIPAGWLIEQAGWKGKSIGNAGSYEKQALVIVNRGGATGVEIWNFAQEIIASVKEKFNISLTTEVNVWI